MENKVKAAVRVLHLKCDLNSFLFVSPYPLHFAMKRITKTLSKKIVTGNFGPKLFSPVQFVTLI